MTREEREAFEEKRNEYNAYLDDMNSMQEAKDAAYKAKVENGTATTSDSIIHGIGKFINSFSKALGKTWDKY